MFIDPVAIPARECKPDQPPAFGGPDIQYTSDWATI